MFHDRPRFIAIASGKGGVGKTWIAVTLAHALTRVGLRVLLFDADLGLANVDVQLGLMPRVDLAAVLSGRTNIAGGITHHESTGVDLLAGRSGSGVLAGLNMERLDLLLTQLRDETAKYDVILADLSAGVDKVARRIAAWSELLLVVMTDEPTSLLDAYAVIKLHNFDRPGADARIVVNQAPSLAAGHATYAALRRACEAFLSRQPPLAAVLRQDTKVREAIRRQGLLLHRYPNCGAAHDIEGLARTCLEVHS